jgi:uncharacterized membrane protein YadS
MKKLIIAGVVILLGVVGFMKYGGALFTVKNQTGIHIGATHAEVQKVWGAPVAMSPSFGREEDIYRLPGGEKHMLIYEDDKVVEIH